MPTKSRKLPPLAARQLSAAMKLKHLDLKSVAKLARVPYHTASNLLRGHVNHPEHFARLAATVQSAPMPREGVMA